jgi:hypothetical protein
MSTLKGESTNAIFGTLKNFIVTYPTIDETLLETPENLAATEPTTPQIAYTVASQHLPTFNFEPISNQWIGNIVIAGRNSDVSNQSISYRLYKNSVLQASGTFTANANNYYTFHVLSSYFQNVVLGDVLAVKLWGNTNVNIDYKAFYVVFSRFYLEKSTRVLYKLQYITDTAANAIPNLTLGNPSKLSGYISCVQITNAGSAIMNITDNSTRGIDITTIKGALGWFRHALGDYSTTSPEVLNSDTLRPYYRTGQKLLNISYYNTNIDI